MKDNNLKQDKEYNQYKTKVDKLIGTTFHKLYDEIGVFGMIVFCLVVLIILIVLIIRLISENYWQCFGFNLADKNNIGDALGGMTAPFIGSAGVILTFFAFWVQYRFNQNQSSIYRDSILNNKRNEYLKLIESIISINKLDDITIKDDIENIINIYNHQITNPNEINIEKFNNLDSLFSKGLQDRFKKNNHFFSYSKANNSSASQMNNIHELKLKEFKKQFAIIKQYHSLLKMYEIDLSHIGIKYSSALREIISLDNKFDILHGLDGIFFKILCLTYLEKKYQPETNYVFEDFYSLKFGKLYTRAKNFLNFYIIKYDK